MNGFGRVRLAMAWVILGVWVGSLVLEAVLPSYDAPTSIHVLMMLVAGAMFGPKIGGRH